MTKACEETKHFYSDLSQPGTCYSLCILLQGGMWEPLTADTDFFSSSSF